MKINKPNQRGQIQLTFSWIYIAIAGAVILLFFFSIVVKQKQVSEERLSVEVVRIMESILTGAGVSESTKNFIDASGLADYTLYFDCIDSVSEFGIQGRPARAQNAIDPLFAPKTMQGRQIIAWSLPYKLPFKVIDFLLITSSSNKYYLTGGDGVFVNEFLNATEGFNREYVTDLSEIDADSEFDVRIVDADGTHIPGKKVPGSLQDFDDLKVSAVVFTGSNQNTIDFYQKEGLEWKKLNKNPVRIISLGGERDAAKYAAIFAGDDKTYQCNMQKAFRRLEILSEVYGGSGIAELQVGGKLGELQEYYLSQGLSAHPDCLGNIQNYPDHLTESLAALKSRAAACQLEEEICLDLISTAGKIQDLNNNLRLNCIRLY